MRAYLRWLLLQSLRLKSALEAGALEYFKLLTEPNYVTC